MDRRRDELIRRPLYVYDLPDDILNTLQRSVSVGVDTDRIDADHTSNHTSPVNDRKVTSLIGSKACSICDVKFSTIEDQRSHVRSDFHSYNLRRKLQGLQAISEDYFEQLVGDLDESLSGSASSESDEDAGNAKENILTALLKTQAATSGDRSHEIVAPTQNKSKHGPGKPPLFWFTTSALPLNTYLGIYQAIFTNLEQNNEQNILDSIRSKQLVAKPVARLHADKSDSILVSGEYKGPHIFLCMIGGGHFAAMVVLLAPKQTKSSAAGLISREATVLAHKTFHRYTTRRKQGGSQSANDSANGAAHSAGSSLRRYNEAALTDEVRLLLSEWKGMIDSSELIFIRATGNTNKRTLFGPYDRQILRQNDPRIRGFPFSTRRATQQELMRAFVELTRVKVKEIDMAAIGAIAASVTDFSKQDVTAMASKQNSSAAQKCTEEDDTAIHHTSQLQALTRRSKLPGLLSYLKTNNLSPDFPFYPQDSQQNHHAPTLLHLAASLNLPVIVTGLLIRAGASPVILNGDCKPAFDLAGDRATRDAFRVARSTLGEGKWDWDVAHIPSALSKSEAESRDARARQETSQKEDERRRAETERLKVEGPKTGDLEPLGKAAGKGRALALGQAQKSTQEKREEEGRGLAPEIRARLERERRARAAEERIKKLRDGG